MEGDPVPPQQHYSSNQVFPRIRLCRSGRIFDDGPRCVGGRPISVGVDERGARPEHGCSINVVKVVLPSPIGPTT